MPVDPFEDFSDSLISPAKNTFAIVPDDSSDLPIATKALYVGTGGTLVLRTVNAVADTIFANVPSGSILPIRVRAVRSTGSSAGDLVGLA